MQEDYPILKQCPLFAKIDKDDLFSLMKCLGARKKRVQKEETLFFAGEQAEYLGIVLEGSVYIHQDDHWGNRTILTTANAGDLFAEAFSCAGSRILPVSVTAKEASVVLLVDCNRILTTCSTSCVFHANLIRNLMQVLAEKNVLLTQKIELLSKKTIREKVLLYLSERALASGKNTITLPYNRQELADFLGVERSALSATLSKMREEGLIDFEKNKFVLLD